MIWKLNCSKVKLRHSLYSMQQASKYILLLFCLLTHNLRDKLLFIRFWASQETYYKSNQQWLQFFVTFLTKFLFTIMNSLRHLLLGTWVCVKECNDNCFDFFFFSVFWWMSWVGKSQSTALKQKKKKHMHTGKELEAH
jgi:hypothetical protein